MNNSNRNNNNNNNNRRRGRGSSRGPSGGGSQFNRIDSRARGNAPQMLEKYKKMAADALLADDRVQAEYYLQFADHYFRVISDSRVQKDEARTKRDSEREPSFDDEGAAVDREEQGGDRRPRSGRSRDEDDEPQSESRPESGAESQADNRADNRDSDAGGGEESEDNPFVRDTRKRRPRSRAKAEVDEGTIVSDGVDPGVLPPSISKSDDGAAPRKPVRTRSRRTRPAEDSDGEALETVN